MNPQAAMLQNLDPSAAHRQALVILVSPSVFPFPLTCLFCSFALEQMPYISYEEFDRQQTVGRLINSTFAEHRDLEKLNVVANADNQADRPMKLFKKSSSKGKERS